MGTIELKLSGPKGLSAIVDEKDYETLDLGSYKWRPLIGRTTVYAIAHKNRKTLYLHRLIMGLADAPRSVLVDHKDHNGLNNSRTNLRVTDKRGNKGNSRKPLSAKSASTYKGVSYMADKNIKPWLSRIKLSGKDKYIGSYRTEIEAARAYNKAAEKHFGTMAYINELPD